MYLIHHNQYESYSLVLVELHTKADLFKDKSVCNKFTLTRKSRLKNLLEDWMDKIAKFWVFL